MKMGDVREFWFSLEPKDCAGCGQEPPPLRRLGFRVWLKPGNTE